MYRSFPLDNPVRRWRQFGRAGRRMAAMFAVIWFSALALLFRVAPAPEPLIREKPPQMSWWAQGGASAKDLLTRESPATFALPTPAGFSHSLRREHAGLTPPVQAQQVETVFLERPEPAVAAGFPKLSRFRPASVEASTEPLGVSSIFPPRVPEREGPRMIFPDGWESRLFAGIDLDFGTWTDQAWSAKVEMRFDEKGVPVLLLLAQPSGLLEVDRRLARSASGWRLLEPSAPRAGIMAWNCPAAEPAVPAPGPAAAGKGAP